MFRSILSRLLAVSLLGGVFGAYAHSMHIRAIALGKDAFLAKESIRFDHFFAQSLPVLVLTYVSLALFVWAIYFGFSLIFARLLRAPAPHGGGTP